jgi:hypothetical protein
MTYAELLQQIRDYTEVDSSVLTNTICDTFIKSSEYRIFRETDADYSREYATSSFMANNRFLILPNNNEDKDGRGSGIHGLCNGDGFGVYFKYHLY